MEVGKMHLYLGMQLKFDEGSVTIDMSYYLDKILKEFSDLKAEALPGKKNLFASSLELLALAEKEK
jgi:hypothetical protein